MQAFHIYFPEEIVQDPNNAALDVVLISGVGTSITATNIKFYVENSFTYNEICQLKLCYLITFDSESNIIPTTIKVTIKNLLNPESVQTTSRITITTLMKYTADPHYYKIDSSE